MKGVWVNIFWANLRPVLGKLVSPTFDKKEWFLIYHLVFLPRVNENCQAAIIFNDRGILTLVEWHEVTITYLLGKVLEVFTVWIRMGFWKTSLTSELYNCQLEKLITRLYDPDKYKNKNPVGSCIMIIGKTKEMNATSNYT